MPTHTLRAGLAIEQGAQWEATPAGLQGALLGEASSARLSCLLCAGPRRQSRSAGASPCHWRRCCMQMGIGCRRSCACPRTQSRMGHGPRGWCCSAAYRPTQRWRRWVQRKDSGQNGTQPQAQAGIGHGLRRPPPPGQRHRSTPCRGDASCATRVWISTSLEVCSLHIYMDAHDLSYYGYYDTTIFCATLNFIFSHKIRLLPHPCFRWDGEGLDW